MEKYLAFNMEIFYYFVFFLLFSKLFFKFKEKKNLPPSPLALPILGHLHLLKKPLHRTLQTISDRYGPIVLLRFGYRHVLTVSSPSAIEECFIKNDVVFANRPTIIAGEHFGYNFTTIGWAPYGHHWRNLRRITSNEIFSPNSIRMSCAVRNGEVRSLVQLLFQGCDQEFVKVDLKSIFLELTFNIMMRVVSGKRCFDKEKMDVEEKKKFLELLKDTFVPTMPMNIGDFLPVLSWFGFGKVEREMVSMQRNRDEFLQALVDEHKRKKSDSSQGDQNKKTVMDFLLSLQEAEPDHYTDQIIKGILVMMFTAGTDTSAVTMEWAMSLLLSHPDVLERARTEIDVQILHDHVLEDSDLAKLPYLHCIINETLRLYPASPLLVPHASSEECTVGGYNVPRGTILFANAWAIHRDPKLWVDPMSFKPDRFESNEVERELGFKFFPFGLGRRRCPGGALGMRVVALALGALLQCFEWERIGEEMVDMSEGSGLTMPKAKPLEAMYRPRQSMMNLLSQL